MKPSYVAALIVAAFVLCAAGLWRLEHLEEHVCDHPPRFDRGRIPPGQRAVLSVGENSTTVIVEYHNDNPFDIEVNIWELGSLLILRCNGEVLPSQPGAPPSLSGEDPKFRIPAGGMHRRVCDLRTGTGESLRAGKYWVAVRGWACEPILCTVSEEDLRR